MGTFFKRYAIMMFVNILFVIVISTIFSFLNIEQYIGKGMGAQVVWLSVWGMGGAFLSLLMSKKLAKWTMGVQIVEEHGPYAEIVRTIHHISKKAGMDVMPEVGIYHSPEVNAFATGPSKSNSLVAVSTGLLERMNKDELEGVLGHEVAHIVNGDMVTMTLVQGVVNSFVMIFARIIATAVDQFLRGDDEEGGGLGFFAHFILIQVLHVVLGFLATPVVAAFSRWREYRADAGSSELVGKHKMIMALERLKSDYDHMVETNREENAVTALQISSKTSIMELFSTHPQLDKRISALRNS